MPEDPTSARIAMTTVANAEEGERLGRILVEERLAACATVIPAVRSVYWWKGQVETAAEALVMLKTVVEKVGLLEARLKELHGYETPEFISIAVEGGSEAYMRWLEGCLGGA